MESSSRFTLDTLRQAICAAEPAALLVEPRILRRVIRLDRRLPGLGISVPHHTSYAVERDRLLAFVDRAELELPAGAELPKVVILLAKPVDEDDLLVTQGGDPRLRYWRMLFHACAHVELERAIPDRESRDAWATERRREIGETEFAEIRAVLLKDDYLFPSPGDAEVYVEFAAVYLELRYFSEHVLPLYFPAVRDWEAIDRLVSRDIDHARLFEQTRLFEGRSGIAGDDGDPTPDAGEPEMLAEDASASFTKFRKRQAWAQRWAAVGNGIKAAIWRMRAARVAPAELAADAHADAHRELSNFVLRLEKVLHLEHDESEEWRLALAPLLAPAAQGYWSNEARLLYDLQKVCIEQERGVYKLDLIEWIRTRGERPLRRPLPLLRQVLIARHLRTANRRVASARMEAPDRERLARLLAGAVNRVEHRLREHLRPRIGEVLDEVGLLPQNTPEQVARRKLVEELLDRIVETGYVSMGDLRDSLSKNDLKLPDVAGVRELIVGDRLLQADRKFDAAFDGVYRRGAVYLRWPQTLSSLAFGTPFGRFLTQYVAIPFGGAYLGLEFLRHYGETLAGHEVPPDLAPIREQPAATPTEAQWPFFGAVFVVGVWLLLLLHRPAFRAWNVALLQQTWKWAKVLVDMPARFVRLPLVQQILNSPPYKALQNYVVQPALATFLISIPWLVMNRAWSLRAYVEVFLAAALVLNSSIGRYATELLSDFFARTWHELRIRILAAVFQWIMDVFHRLALALERVVYSVDEWLRFRAGDRRAAQAVKLTAGVAWFFVAYLVVFAFTLLIEPQVNPIKHFPVVTVSHKLLLPLAFTGKPASVPSPFAETLMFVFPISVEQANWMAMSIIWGIPGVFGFLVWELKENWRLYAANRPRLLRPVPIGKHGETMVRLLRPGFHSGTLPKAFAALRRAARKAEHTGNWKPVNRRWTTVQHVEEAVRRFIERELIGLLQEVDFLPGRTLSAGAFRAATNRVEIELCRSDKHGQPLVLSWEDDAGVLTAAITHAGWLDSLGPRDREVFAAALAGLFQRSGVDQVRAPAPLEADFAVDAESRIAWEEWSARWSPTAASPEAPVLPSPSVATRAG
jgi:hypothetical protein